MNIEYNNNDFTILHHSTKGGSAQINIGPATFIWEHIEADKPARTIFSSLDIINPQGLLDFLNNPNNIIHIGLYRGRLASLGWTNSVRAKTGHVHFVTFKWAYGRVNKLTCEKFLYDLLYTKGGPEKGGEYLFNCLIGLTPVNNKLACRFVKGTGFIESGIVPQGDLDPESGEPIDCMLTYLTRDILEGIDRYKVYKNPQ